MGNKIVNSWVLLYGVLILGLLIGCTSKDGTSFSDKVKASSFNGSVEPVENFLKKQYLRDPDSYKSVEWGKLIKNSDGSFQVSHRFSAKNGFGGMNTETVLFCISENGKEVHICTDRDVRRIARTAEIAEHTKINDEYLENDFSKVIFEGSLTETIDGVPEKSNIRGELTKNGKEIKGDLLAIETNINYHLEATILAEGKATYKLKNLTTGLITELEGVIVSKLLSGWTSLNNFSLNLNDTRSL